MLSVEDVATLLKLKPFTVRKMFRDGTLSGFKIGKSWRIAEMTLQADLEHLRIEGTRESSQSGRAGGQDEPPEEFEPVQLKRKAKASRDPQAPEPSGSGNLLVFSEVPGQEVYLDGEKKGPTTLSVLGVSEGPHRLRVGAVSEMIYISSDSELRVTSIAGALSIASKTKGQAKG